MTFTDVKRYMYDNPRKPHTRVHATRPIPIRLHTDDFFLLAQLEDSGFTNDEILSCDEFERAFTFGQAHWKFWCIVHKNGTEYKLGYDICYDVERRE